MDALQKYLDKIFGTFETLGCRVGQGGFFTRTWMNDRSLTQVERTHLFDVLNVLIQNGLIANERGPRELPFITLTEKGYEYTQGGSLLINDLSLNELLDGTPKDQTYNRLWDFIGKKEDAPFYLGGKNFFETIAPYVNLNHLSYSQYTAGLHEQGKSTSRRDWFKDLFSQLSEDDIPRFLDDLSKTIVKVYLPLLNVPDEEEIPDWDSLFAQPATPTMHTEHIPSVAPVELEVANYNPHPKKKKVIFISYTWETKITPGHKAWVKQLAESLKQRGFDVRLDQDQRLGTEMNHFMASSVRESDRIILICTPEFKRRSDELDGACGFEASLISKNLIKDITSIKFLPLVRIGEPQT